MFADLFTHLMLLRSFVGDVLTIPAADRGSPAATCDTLQAVYPAVHAALVAELADYTLTETAAAARTFLPVPESETMWLALVILELRRRSEEARRARPA